MTSRLRGPGKQARATLLAAQVRADTAPGVPPPAAGLACGLTRQAVDLYEAAKAQRREQARVDP